MTVFDRINLNLSTMSASMKAIATTVLQDPKYVSKAHIAALANRSGTANATVTRFCRLIGYSGYVDFRISLAVDMATMQSAGTWEFEERPIPGLPQAHLFTQLRRADEARIASVFDDTNPVKITQLCQKIVESREIHVYARGLFSSMGEVLARSLYREGKVSHFWSDGYFAPGEFSTDGHHSVMLAIGPDDSSSLTNALQTSRKSGAFTAVIGAAVKSRAASGAELHLHTPHNDTGSYNPTPFAYYRSVSLICEIVLAQVQSAACE
ncbi:MurR/RpiR family transcriptional regulator [Plantibacter sp. YIM 135347]|uniref:MurR/RpiR family transcriptional regulator n=1 Tax=Plantibacter sp. YIM 135347 TaxID=3423919 RepID=UPI003D332C47